MAAASSILRAALGALYDATGIRFARWTTLMACDVGTLCFFVLSALDLCSASLLASMRACVRACPALIQLNSTRAVDASLSVDGDVLQYQMSFLNLTCVDVVDERH